MKRLILFEKIGHWMETNLYSFFEAVSQNQYKSTMKYFLIFLIDLVKNETFSRKLSSKWRNLIMKTVSIYEPLIANGFKDSESSKWKIIGLLFKMIATSHNNHVMDARSTENKAELNKLTLHMIGCINCTEFMGFANNSMWVLNWVDILSSLSDENMLAFGGDANVRNICIGSLGSINTTLCGCAQNIVMA